MQVNGFRVDLVDGHVMAGPIILDEANDRLLLVGEMLKVFKIECARTDKPAQLVECGFQGPWIGPINRGGKMFGAWCPPVVLAHHTENGVTTIVIVSLPKVGKHGLIPCGDGAITQRKVSILFWRLFKFDPVTAKGPSLSAHLGVPAVVFHKHLFFVS